MRVLCHVADHLLQGSIVYQNWSAFKTRIEHKLDSPEKRVLILCSSISSWAPHGYWSSSYFWVRSNLWCDDVADFLWCIYGEPPSGLWSMIWHNIWPEIVFLLADGGLRTCFPSSRRRPFEENVDQKQAEWMPPFARWIGDWNRSCLALMDLAGCIMTGEEVSL